jgi:hypothetical protein
MKRNARSYALVLLAVSTCIAAAGSAAAAPSVRKLTATAPVVSFKDAGPQNHYVSGVGSFFSTGASLNPTANVGKYISKISLFCGGVSFPVSSGKVSTPALGQLVVLCPFGLPTATSAKVSLESL